MVVGFLGVKLMSVHQGNWNEALTSLASLSVSSPGMAVNSLHQVGRLHSLALHHTQSVGLDMGSSTMVGLHHRMSLMILAGRMPPPP